MHILIAEDAPDVAEVVAFSARLTWPDARVTTAGGGAEALAAFAAQPTDLIILDVNMPRPTATRSASRSASARTCRS